MWQVLCVLSFFALMIAEDYYYPDGNFSRIIFRIKNYIPLLFFIGGFILVDAGVAILD